MSFRISKLVRTLEPSATMAMSAKAKELKAAGKTVYDLSLGEPDFGTPQHICDAAVAAMQAGHTKYTVAGGIPDLKNAIVDDYQRRTGLRYAPAQVVVSNGAKHALNNVFTTTLDPGDEVILPAPYWVSYAEQIQLAGGTPVIVATEQSHDFKLTPEAFRAAITPKTRTLLLCNPSNPTGAMYSKAELEALAEIVLENDLCVVSDEIYDRLVYGDGTFVSFPTLRPELPQRTIVVNGVSKTYAMTGWRIGWTLAPQDVSQKIAELQSQEASNPCSISQYAALAALRGDQTCVAEMRAEFARRRDYVQKRVAAIGGLSCPEMGGAFYAFINIGGHLGRPYGGVRVDTSGQWCLGLLEQKCVATVMGSAFGCEGYVRASFAASQDVLEASFDLIEEYLAS